MLQSSVFVGEELVDKTQGPVQPESLQVFSLNSFDGKFVSVYDLAEVFLPLSAVLVLLLFTAAPPVLEERVFVEEPLESFEDVETPQELSEFLVLAHHFLAAVVVVWLEVVLNLIDPMNQGL